MQFLKILFWCLLAFVAAIFTFSNWTTVSLNLWGGLVAEVNLPLLLLIAFLIGLLPTYFYHQAIRWRLRNRLATAERALTDLRGILAPAPALVVEPEAATPAVTLPTTVPPGAA